MLASTKFLRLQNLTKQASFADVAGIFRKMSATTGSGDVVKKPRYDGRMKKRQWEERRNDKGEALNVKRVKEEGFERVKRRKYAMLLGYSGVDYFGMQRNPNMRTIEEDLFNALLKADYITQEGYDQVQTMQFQRAARTDKGVSAARQIVSLKLPEEVDISKINDHLPSVIRVFGLKRVTKGFNSKSQCDARTYMYMLPTAAFSEKESAIAQEEYRLNEEKLKEINEILNLYVGTKNYHNFTSKKKNNDPSAVRYIMSFICEEPFLRKGVEFAVLKVKGQSFMMHQIRKMVGLVLAIIKGHTNKEILTKAFSTERVNIPRAPGLGLVLDYVHYQRYNYRYGSDGMHESLEWEAQDDLVNKFKEEYIYPTIINTEITEKCMVEWLSKLYRHGFDADEDEEEEDNENGDSDSEEISKEVPKPLENKLQVSKEVLKSIQSDDKYLKSLQNDEKDNLKSLPNGDKELKSLQNDDKELKSLENDDKDNFKSLQDDDIDLKSIQNDDKDLKS